ncbi:MAG: hypothetical protein MUE46_11460, partial [Xanthomonadales bacterium]|nr:hypothetical protein [Xanthomonadales bacterium]
GAPVPDLPAATVAHSPMPPPYPAATVAQVPLPPPVPADEATLVRRPVPASQPSNAPRSSSPWPWIVLSVLLVIGTVLLFLWWGSRTSTGGSSPAVPEAGGESGG